MPYHFIWFGNLLEIHFFFFYYLNIFSAGIIGSVVWDSIQRSSNGISHFSWIYSSSPRGVESPSTAYLLVKTLMWVMPLTIIYISGHWVCFSLHEKGHPWKGILTDEKEEKEKKLIEKKVKKEKKSMKKVIQTKQCNEKTFSTWIQVNVF